MQVFLIMSKPAVGCTFTPFTCAETGLPANRQTATMQVGKHVYLVHCISFHSLIEVLHVLVESEMLAELLWHATSFECVSECRISSFTRIHSIYIHTHTHTNTQTHAHNLRLQPGQGASISPLHLQETLHVQK